MIKHFNLSFFIHRLYKFEFFVLFVMFCSSFLCKPLFIHVVLANRLFLNKITQAQWGFFLLPKI